MLHLRCDGFAAASLFPAPDLWLHKHRRASPEACELKTYFPSSWTGRLRPEEKVIKNNRLNFWFVYKK
jgi:hypothetical protein